MVVLVYCRPHRVLGSEDEVSRGLSVTCVFTLLAAAASSGGLTDVRYCLPEVQPAPRKITETGPRPLCFPDFPLDPEASEEVA